jgi:hypothetical protein
MANTKKEWAHMSAFEKGVQIFVNIAVLLIAALLPYFAYFVPVECDLDNVYPWCWVHPGNSVGDLIGWVLYGFGAFWLSGIWGYFVTDDDQDPWKTVGRIAWCCAAAGPLLIILT